MDNERPTHHVIAIVFRNVRKDNQDFVVSEDVFGNVEKVKHSKEFLPRKKDFVEQKDQFKKAKVFFEFEGKPIGYVVDFHFDDKYSDNPRWFTGLVVEIRFFKKEIKGVLKKLGQESLYALNYGLEYSPKCIKFEKDGKTHFKITGIGEFGISVVEDPSFVNCKTIMMYFD